MSGDVSIKTDKSPFWIWAQHLVLIFFGFFLSLAEKLECSREELSEAINKGFLLKFNDFINSYRVEAFKTKLAEGLQDQLSLLGIAFECGFNSKATFNRAFKKFTNVSPTQYLNSIK